MAKALEVIGERWTLLIVRELLVRGPSRYTDLRNGLPGIATNLLADRLRDLEQAGIVRREAAPPPIAATLFHLTERGEELAPLVWELGRWGAPLLGPEPAEDEAFLGHWLPLPIENNLIDLIDSTPESPPITIEVRTGDELLVIETVDGTLRTRPGEAEHPDAVLIGTPKLIFSVLAGRLDLAEARTRGLQYEGDPETLRRIQPRALTSPSEDPERSGS
jgi:DNA-binding HxlR family transcriptional regulator